MISYTNNTEKMEWKQIMEKYPDMWVGLVGVDRDENDEVTSAIVAATGDKFELSYEKVCGNFDDALYTTPNNLIFDNYTQWGMICVPK